MRELMRATRSIGRLVVLAVVSTVWMTSAALAEPAAKATGSQVPAELRNGEAKFKANCARCHGEHAVGTKQGPPLVHKIYEPSHHGDAAFQRAAAHGVRAHHWSFGDMPRVEAVNADDVTQIIQYIRWLQRQAGIK